jgi:Spy/CpxP family protein refolding chaperone
MGKVQAEQFKLYRLMKGENAESKVVVEQQKKVDEARREMFATNLEMRKQVEAVLTPEQRKQLKQMGPGWGMPAE